MVHGIHNLYITFRYVSTYVLRHTGVYIYITDMLRHTGIYITMKEMYE